MNVTIIYEGSECGRQASALLKRASDRAEAATQWLVKPWRLDMLDCPPLAQEALRDAAEAHLLLLAVCGEASRSSGLLNWLEAWAAHRQVQAATLAVLDRGHGDMLSTTASPELSAFAQRHGLSFIFGNVSPEDAKSPELWDDSHGREAVLTPTMMLCGGPILAKASPGGHN
jgi:hypothetical protein